MSSECVPDGNLRRREKKSVGSSKRQVWNQVLSVHMIRIHCLTGNK